MFDQIKIENFKVFKNENSIRVAPITLIYGQNSSGKSSIIQTLLLLNQTIKNPDARQKFELSPKGENIDLGVPGSFFHKGNRKKSFQITFQDKACFSGDVFYSHPGRNSSDKELAWLESLQTQFQDLQITLSYFKDESSDSLAPVKLRKFSYVFFNKFGKVSAKYSLVSSNERGDNRFKFDSLQSVRSFAKIFLIYYNSPQVMRRRVRVPQAVKFTVENLKPLLVKLLLGRGDGLGRGEGLLPRLSIDEVTSLTKDDRDNFRIYMSVMEFFHYFNRRFEVPINRLEHIGGLRNSPQRYYPLNSAVTRVGRDGENTATLLYRQNSNELINSWLKLLEIPYKITVEPIGDPLAGSLLVIKLTDLRSKVQVTPTDVGVGISQVLPIMAQALPPSDHKNSGLNNRLRENRPVLVRCIEQPELHLHPKLQANLADFFIDTIEKNSQIRWILETHSEALMLRLQRRIRDKKIKPKDISVNYVNPVGGGASSILELRLDEDGDFIDEWPNGFFEESFKEKFSE
jgi:hypothetical protein